MFRFLCFLYFLCFSFLCNAVNFQSFFIFDEILNQVTNRFISLPDEALQLPYLYEIKNEDIEKWGVHGYRYKLPVYITELINNKDGLSAVLFEDGVLLRKVNCWHSQIESLGAGRTHFSENGNLYFSTSDNSSIIGKKFVIALSMAIKEKEENDNLFQQFNEREVRLNDEIGNNQSFKNYFFSKKINNQFQIDVSEVEKWGTYGYRYKLPTYISDLIIHNGISSAILIENNTILDKINCWHGSIQDLGMGRTSFYENGYLYFSTSDNSPLDDKNFYIVLDRPFLEEHTFEVNFYFPLNEEENYILAHNYKVLTPIEDYRINNINLIFNSKTKNGIFSLVKRDENFQIKNVNDHFVLRYNMNFDHAFEELGNTVKNFTGILETNNDVLKASSVFNKKNKSNIYRKSIGEYQFYSTSPKIHSYNAGVFEYLSLELPRWSMSMVPDALLKKIEASGAQDIKIFFNVTGADFEILEIRAPYLVDMNAPYFDDNPGYNNPFHISAAVYKFNGESIAIGQVVKNGDGLYDGEIGAHGDGADIVVSPPNFNLNIEKAIPGETQSLISLIVYDEQNDNGFTYKPRKVAAITYHWLLDENLKWEFLNLIQNVINFRDVLNEIEQSEQFKDSVYLHELKKLLLLN